MSFDVSLVKILTPELPPRRTVPVALPVPDTVSPLSSSTSSATFASSSPLLPQTGVALCVAGFGLWVLTKVVRSRRPPTAAPGTVTPSPSGSPARTPHAHTIASAATTRPEEEGEEEEDGEEGFEESAQNTRNTNTMHSPSSPTNHRYERLEYLGRGAFGVVHKGRHCRTGDLVAIKEMAAAQGSELRTEYEILVHLPRHPNIVQVLAFDVTRHHARLYLEWMAGGSLADSIRKYPLTEPLAKSYCRQILSGLQFLHEHGIVHRDIKPRNILIDHRGVLKLTDFGLSRHMSSMRDRTRIGGTLAYLAPEGAMGHFGVGSDIWALGATLSEMLTRRVPWSHLDANICGDEAPFLYHLGAFRGQAGHHPTIPRDERVLTAAGQAFMERLLAPFPAMRGTCAELLQDPWFTQVEDGEGDSNMGSPEASKQVLGEGGNNDSHHSSSGNTFSQQTDVSK